MLCFYVDWMSNPLFIEPSLRGLVFILLIFYAFFKYRNARIPPPAANFLSEPLIIIAFSIKKEKNNHKKIEKRQRKERLIRKES